MTTIAYPDRCAHTTVTTGTGTLTLGATIDGHRVIPAALDTRLLDYVIEASDGAWEVVRGGVYTNAGTTLTRGTFVASSTGAVLTLVAGTHTVRISPTGDRADLWETGKENVGVAAAADAAHTAAFAHGDIAHANRAALNLVSGTNTGDNIGLTRISGATGAAGADVTVLQLSANTSDVTTVATVDVITITGVGIGTWALEGWLVYQTGVVTTGIGIVVHHTGTVTRFVSTWMHATTGGAAATGVGDQVGAVVAGSLIEGKAERVNNTLSSATAGVDTINADILAKLDALIVVSATGEIHIAISSEIAATAVRLMAGSSLRLTKLS